MLKSVFALRGHFREAQNNGIDVLPSVSLFQYDQPFKKYLHLHGHLYTLFWPLKWAMDIA